MAKTLVARLILASVLLITSISALACSAEKKVSQPELNILKNHFFFDGSIQLLRENPLRGTVRKLYGTSKMFTFLAADKQMGLNRDNYLGGNLYVIGISFTYSPGNNRLFHVTVPVNPIMGETEALKLLRQAKDSTSTPVRPPYESSKLYLLGSHSFKDDSDVVVRITLRESRSKFGDSTNVLYTIEYFISMDK